MSLRLVFATIFFSLVVFPITGADTPVAGQPADAFQVGYAINLGIGDSFVDILNAGTEGVDTVFGRKGNICVNVYTFDLSPQMVTCCSCLYLPDQLSSLSVRSDLVGNPLTPTLPNSIAIKLLASLPVGGKCNATSPSGGSDLAQGMTVWGNTLHAAPSGAALTTVPFLQKVLSTSELTRLTAQCGFIQANGSGFGICRCKATGPF